jgi:hypothetical protein
LLCWLRGDVRQANRRVGLVDVLTARAAGAEGVGAHVGRVDVDLDRVVDLRVDEEAGKAGVTPTCAVERALSHQAVHAGFGAQVAESVVALHLDRGAADPGGVAFAFFEHFGLVALALAVLQVLTQQHGRPVAGLGAAGAGLDVDEAVARVGRVVEHAPELEFLDRGFKCVRLGLDGLEAVEIPLGLGHLVELEVVREVAPQVVDGLDHGLQRFLLAAQFLGTLGVVPDRGVLERRVDLVQAQGLAVVVKDTPLARRCALRGRPVGCRSG